MKNREPFGGRWWGIWNVEGDGEPLVLFRREDAALSELNRCRGLPDDNDEHMTTYHQVFPCDLVGVWWNSMDPDPRADDPLGYMEVIDAYKGDL